MVSVKAAATGKVSCGPMVSGLGPLEHPDRNTRKKTSLKSTHRLYLCSDVQL